MIVQASTMFSPVPFGTVTGYDGTIKVAGGKFVNGHGTALGLRGYNLFGLESGYPLGCDQGAVNPAAGGFGFAGWGFWGNPFPGPATQTFMNYLKSIGVNCLRIPVNTASFLAASIPSYQTILSINGGATPSLNATYKSDPAGTYLTQLFTLVDLAAQNGIYSIIDQHNAAPDFTISSINGGATFHPAPDHDQGGMPNATNSVLFMQTLAPMLANRPYCMVDLFNEPTTVYQSSSGSNWNFYLNGGTSSQYELYNGGNITYTYSNPGMQAVLTAFRNAGGKNVCLAGGINWAGQLDNVTAGSADGWLNYKPTDPLNQLACSVHIYPSNSGPQYGASGYATNYGNPHVVASVESVLSAGFPVFIGEAGGSCGLSGNASFPNEPFCTTLCNLVDSTNATYGNGSIGITWWSADPQPPATGGGLYQSFYQTSSTQNWITTSGQGGVTVPWMASHA